MPTIRQKKAVKRIVENGGIVSRAMRDVGYSKNTAKTPQKLTESKGYEEETKPLLERYQKELNEILKAMALKNKNTEQYRILVDAADKIQKQIQLLSGGATGNIGMIIQISQEIAQKNGINSLPGTNSV